MVGAVAVRQSLEGDDADCCAVDIECDREWVKRIVMVLTKGQIAVY